MSDLKKEIDKIQSVEDYLKYKEKLDELDEQSYNLDLAPEMPTKNIMWNSQVQPRHSILKTSKYNNINNNNNNITINNNNINYI